MRRQTPNLTSNLISIALTWSLALLTAAATAQASTPPRTESGATLVVPDEQAKLGKPFYVMSGEDVQVTFTSDAPLTRVTGTNSGVVGYAVVAEEPESASGPLLAGGFRLPVASFDTGIPLRNEHLQGDRFLDTASYPDVEFELTGTEDTSVFKRDDEKGFVTYATTLVGDMTVKNITKPMRIPARITMMQGGQMTRMRGGGELLAIRCDYSIKLSDFGVGKGLPFIGSKVSDEIQIQQFLVLSPTSPEASLRKIAEKIGDDRQTKIRKFRDLLTRQRDADAAYDFGRTVMKEYWGEAQVLSQLALIAMDRQAARRSLSFALEAARRAVDVSEEKDAVVLDTLAQVYSEKGEFDQAILWQRKAADHAADLPPRFAQRIKQTLARYEKEASN